MFNFGLWIKKSRWELTTIFPMQFMGSQIMQSYSLNLGGLLCFVVSLFMMLLMMNMMGLLPYIFSSTSHLAVTFNLAFPIWLTLLISSIMKNPYHFTAALLPSGAPAILNPFLILVEMVSLSVRPITLAVRLTANMAAGHIVLGLVGTFLKSNIFLNNILVTLMLTITQVFYFLFEFGVSVIQGYIFCLLIILYATEHSYA
nr:ATP synthase F0 subunit 6 [Acharax sp. NY-2022]